MLICISSQPSLISDSKFSKRTLALHRRSKTCSLRATCPSSWPRFSPEKIIKYDNISIASTSSWKPEIIQFYIHFKNILKKKRLWNLRRLISKSCCGGGVTKPIVVEAWQNLLWWKGDKTCFGGGVTKLIVVDGWQNLLWWWGDKTYFGGGVTKPIVVVGWQNLLWWGEWQRLQNRTFRFFQFHNVKRGWIDTLPIGVKGVLEMTRQQTRSTEDEGICFVS